MVNRIGLLISIGIVGLLSYLKGYVDGSFYGYILGRRIRERNGRIQELINSGHTLEDATYIVENRFKTSRITEEEIN